jgi:hypothetical protein
MAQNKNSAPKAMRLQPPQHQSREPGHESKMIPRPEFEPKYCVLYPKLLLIKYSYK